MADSPVTCAVGKRAETLRFYAFGYDAVLPSNVIGILDVHVIPWSPRHIAVIHNNILTVVQGQSAFAAVDALTASHAYVSHDDVLAFGGNDTSAVDGNAFARCSLSGDGDVTGDGDTIVCDINDTADVEHDDAPRLAHSISQ